MSIIWSKLLGNAQILIKLAGGAGVIFFAILSQCNGHKAKEYASQIVAMQEIHTKELNSAGDTIYKTIQTYYTKDNLRESNDPTIVQLLADFDNLKLRKVDQLFTTNAHTTTKFNTDITRDTLIIRDTVPIKVHEFEAYDNGILSMERIVNTNNDSIATYEYNYSPTISGAISWHKEGKWKLKNLWNWRPKVWSISIHSNDDNMIIEDTDFIYVGKMR